MPEEETKDVAPTGETSSESPETEAPEGESPGTEVPEAQAPTSEPAQEEEKERVPYEVVESADSPGSSGIASTVS